MSKEGVFKAWEATLRKTQAAKKRANSIFGTISIAPHTDDDDGDHHHHHNSNNNSKIDRDDQNNDGSGKSTGELYQAERVLPNGDYYTGQWYDNFPTDKANIYGRMDACISEIGTEGKQWGKGRFNWPTGTSYEGEFKSGYMDGSGVYISNSGSVYKGKWVMNLKHGHGRMNYSNGDCYDGEWRRGLQDGEGKYQWKNGDYYSGEWENGVISGEGSFVWMNGNLIDGFWEEGLPKGNGTFKWTDGSYYEGNWSKDGDEQTGTYFPPESSPETTQPPDWDPHKDVFEYLANESQVCVGEKVSIMPSQKKLAVWNSSKRVDKPRRMSVDGRVSVGVERAYEKMNMWESDGETGCYDHLGDGRRDLDSELLGLNIDQDFNQKNTCPIAPLRLPRAGKKQGTTISKGHKNYELMLNLQLGIRHSVGRPAPSVSLDLKNSAFDPKEKVWTRFPSEGSKHTPPHQSCEFKWKDYCPLVFRSLRKLFKVDAADYMLSICGNDALRELSSPGKSGSFFYLTNDDRYMIKTMKKAEVKVLIRMLAAYYNHVRAFENTAVIKFYGLHCVKLTGPTQKKVRFIIMGNLFCSEYTIHRKFDLKGSSLGRTTDKPESQIDENTILKDLDLNYIFRLQKAWYQEFCRQVDKDCEFLEQERIMDYSLLVGLHFRETSVAGELIPSGAQTQTPTGDGDGESGPRLSRADAEQLVLDPKRWASIRLGIKMPARVERTVRRSDCEFQLVGEPTGECYEVIMFFGIIDILQDYDISKKLEHAYKSIQYDPTSISAVDPKQYSKRFRDFIYKVFHEDC